MSCEKCGGTFHVFEDGAFKRCDCFVDFSVKRSQSLPEAFAGVTVADLWTTKELSFSLEAKKIVGFLVKRIGQSQKPSRIPVFRGSPNQPTPLVAALMNFANSRGLDAERITLTQLGYFYFDNQPDYFKYFGIQVLFLQLRGGVENKGVVSLLDETIQERVSRNKITVITVETKILHQSTEDLLSRDCFLNVKL